MHGGTVTQRSASPWLIRYIYILSGIYNCFVDHADEDVLYAYMGGHGGDAVEGGIALSRTGSSRRW